MKKETKKNKAASASAETATNKNIVSKPDATDTTTHTMDVPTDVEKDINDLKQSKIVFDSKLMSWIEQRHLKVERG